MTTKELAKKPAQFVAERPDWMKETSERGSENVGLDDVTIPRLEVIQSLSPQRKKNDPAYIEGAEEGMLFNSATSELFKGAVYICPVYFRKEWVIWKDRNQGGGFKGAFSSPDLAQAELESMEQPAGHDIVDTHQHFCLLIAEDGSVSEIVLSMSRSKMKISRNLNTQVRLAGGDRFSRIYKLSAVEDKSDKGEYFNFKIEAVGYAPKEVYEAAEQTYEAVKGGARDVAREDVEGGNGANNSQADPIDEM